LALLIDPKDNLIEKFKLGGQFRHPPFRNNGCDRHRDRQSQSDIREHFADSIAEAMIRRINSMDWRETLKVLCGLDGSAAFRVLTG
jgi:hypothetical protein